MNILIPHTWLLEHLETDATPEEIQKYLSLSGPSVERIYQTEGEPVYDIEVTTNRVDSMSVRGIAREAAVILQQFGKKGKLKPLPSYASALNKPSKSKLPLPKVVNNPDLCKRVLMVALAGVERTPTPAWMAKRLRQIDANVHDAVIDITNYVTHDLGHPCHAFDYDALFKLGGEILVKEAKAGKKFITLDGVEYTTVGGEVVFENAEGVIIDLPSIKGTANTSISTQTKNVLFFSEDTVAKKVRFASMTHAIRTVAAQLLEKNVDPELALPVMEEGIKLFEDLCAAKVASTISDDFPGRKKLPTVKVKLSRIVEYLGIELAVNTIAKILEDLGCEVELKSQQLWVSPPSFRPDIAIPADVIEEVARIYGYHNLPSVLMPTPIPIDRPIDTNFFLENRLKRFLADIGWQELYSYSMVSEKIALESGYALSEHLKIQNYLTDDRIYLRRSLVPSLEEVIAQNSQRPELNVFEIANVYEPQPNNLPWEDLRLSLVSTRSFRIVKGELEALLKQLFITQLEVIPMLKPFGPYAQIGAIRTVITKKKKQTVDLGTIGTLHNGHIAIVLGMKNLLRAANSHPIYQPIPKTSEVIEDLTFILPIQTAISPFIEQIRKISPLVKSVQLKDVYGANFTFTLTYFTPQENVTVEEVAPLRKKIVETLVKKFDAKLVGKLA